MLTNLEYVPRLFSSITYELRSIVATSPPLFFTLLASKKQSLTQAVNKNTDIVIEGFPRSGNRFAVGAFKQAQNDAVNIATHLHAPSQIIRGTQRSLPVLVVIRKPSEAVTSFKALILESHDRLNTFLHPWSLSQILRSNTRFYTSILPIKE